MITLLHVEIKDLEIFTHCNMNVSSWIILILAALWSINSALYVIVDG